MSIPLLGPGTQVELVGGGGGHFHEGSPSGSAAAASGPGGSRVVLRVQPNTVRKLAVAYYEHHRDMPDGRREEIEAVIRAYVGRAEGQALQPGDLERASAGQVNPPRPTRPLPRILFPSGCALQAMLAGLGKARRRWTLRDMAARGAPLPPDLAAEAARVRDPGHHLRAGRGGEVFDYQTGSAAGGAAGAQPGDDDNEGEEDEEAGAAGPSTAKPAAPPPGLSTLELGQYWHGARVVERLLGEQGSEGLFHLARRFRESFVESLQPRYLPPAWKVGMSCASWLANIRLMLKTALTRQVDHDSRRQFGAQSIYNPEGRTGRSG